MLATSVAVVKKMLEAVAGSAPIFLRPKGTKAPHTPLTTQLPVMARKTTIPKAEADGWLTPLA